MNEQSRRKALQAQYKQAQPEAGVYRIVNRGNGKALLGSTPDLASVRNKFAFAQRTNTPGVLDQRLSKDIHEFGLDAFSLEVLEVVQPAPEMTPAEFLDEVVTLEALWREKHDPALLY